jgi:predicted PurR-regulated permease PerM
MGFGGIFVSVTIYTVLVAVIAAYVQNGIGEQPYMDEIFHIRQVCALWCMCL